MKKYNAWILTGSSVDNSTDVKVVVVYAVSIQQALMTAKEAMPASYIIEIEEVAE